MGKKKIISMIVSIAMLVAMFPMIVHADDDPAKLSFQDLQDAVSAGGTVMLSQSYEYKETDTCGSIKVTKPVMLMAVAPGITIDRKLDAVPDDGDGNVFTVEENGSLMIQNFGGGILEIKGGCALNGAGILVNEGGSCTLFDDVKVTGNTSTNYGGGIYVEGTLNCLGCGGTYGPTIKSNNALIGDDVYVATKGTLCLEAKPDIGDLYLPNEKTIIITGGLYNDAKIGITTGGTIASEEDFIVFTSGFGTNGVESNFVSNDGYAIVKNSNNELQLESSGSIEVIKPKIEYCNIVLDGKIGLYIYVDPGTYSANDLANSSMVIDVGSRETDPIAFANGEFVEYESQSLYRFRCDLSSMEMGVTILCMLKNGDETLAQASLSVNAYLKRLIANNRIPNGVEKAFVNYAHYMWPYLKSIHSSGENAWASEYPQVSTVYDDIIEGYTTDYDAIIAKCEENGIKAASKGIEDSGVTKITFQLEFETTNAFMVYFYLDPELAYTANSISVTVNGEKKRAYKVADNKYRVRINDIYLQDLETEYVITGNCGGTEDFSVTASPMSYVYTALRNSASSTAKKDAMVSIYWLWDMASRYNQ